MSVRWFPRIWLTFTCLVPGMRPRRLLAEHLTEHDWLHLHYRDKALLAGPAGFRWRSFLPKPSRVAVDRIRPAGR